MYLTSSHRSSLGCYDSFAIQLSLNHLSHRSFESLGKSKAIDYIPSYFKRMAEHSRVAFFPRKEKETLQVHRIMFK